MKNLKKLREKIGISQKILAQRLNIGYTTYNHYETGKREPDNETICKLANFFDVSVDYLFGNTDDPRTLDQQLEGIEFALWGEVKEMTDAQKQDVLDYIKFKKAQRGE